MGKLVQQFMKFGVVGVIAFVIDYGLMVALTELAGVNYLISATISFTVSVVFNYLALAPARVRHLRGALRDRPGSERSAHVARLVGSGRELPHREDRCHGHRHGVQLRDAQDLPRRRHRRRSRVAGPRDDPRASRSLGRSRFGNGVLLRAQEPSRGVFFRGAVFEKLVATATLTPKWPALFLPSRHFYPQLAFFCHFRLKMADAFFAHRPFLGRSGICPQFSSTVSENELRTALPRDGEKASSLVEWAKSSGSSLLGARKAPGRFIQGASGNSQVGTGLVARSALRRLLG